MKKIITVCASVLLLLAAIIYISRDDIFFRSPPLLACRDLKIGMSENEIDQIFDRYDPLVRAEDRGEHILETAKKLGLEVSDLPDGFDGYWQQKRSEIAEIYSRQLSWPRKKNFVRVSLLKTKSLELELSFWQASYLLFYTAQGRLRKEKGESSDFNADKAMMLTVRRYGTNEHLIQIYSIHASGKIEKNCKLKWEIEGIQEI